MGDANLPKVTGSSPLPVRILLINPNSTQSMTLACLESLSGLLPRNCTVTGLTAPHPAPSAIEGALDSILSSAACIRAIKPIAHEYDAFLVACFSKHYLIDALREEFAQPTIGIMEAAIYTARMLGARFGIVATAARSKFMQEDAVKAYGLEGHYAGTESTGLGVLELETKPREEVLDRVEEAAKRLVARGADCLLLGCAGMTSFVRRCEEAVASGENRDNVNVIDGVVVGVQLLYALINSKLSTAKGGMYCSSEESRKARGQDWV